MFSGTYHKTLFSVVIALGFLCGTPKPAPAQEPAKDTPVVVEFTDGGQVRGTIRELTADRVVLDTPYGRLSIPRPAIRRLREIRWRETPERPTPAPAPTRAAPSIVSPEQIDAATGRRPTERLVFATPPEFAVALMPDLVERFAALYGVHSTEWSVEPGRKIARFEDNPVGFPKKVEILVADRARALALLRAGKVQAVVARETDEEEPEDLEEHVIGLDALAVTVHPDNPLRRISRATLARVFAGEIETWAEILRYDRPVRRISPGRELSSARLFVRRVMGEHDFAPGTIFVRTPDDLLDELYTDAGGIGYGSLGTLAGSRILTLAECGIPQPPTPFRIRSENYPLTQRIDLYLRADRYDGWEDVFALFLTGPHGAAIIPDHQLEPLAIRPATTREQQAWVNAVLGTPPQVERIRQAFLELTRRARKLSVEFRFETGSAELDERAREDVGRLARWLESRNIPPERLVLAGYADSRGSYDSNLTLARRRAEAVAEALAAIGIRAGEVLAFGEEIAVACDTDAYGRHLNRRVEAWLR